MSVFKCFFYDNLLNTNAGHLHPAETPTEDEEMSKSLENTIVLLWLPFKHNDLPKLVLEQNLDLEH